MRFQKTISNSVTTEGIGLHSGRVSQVTFRPAPADTGIVFRRDGVKIKASFENVTETLFSTNLGVKGTTVRTAEHLLAALAGLGVSNLFVDVDGLEVPILDGSALPFVNLFLKTGILTQDKPQPVLRIVKPVVYGEGTAYVMALPSSEYRISCRVNFNHPAIREEDMEVVVTPASFIQDIAGARTFGFLKDVHALRERGLAMGGSMDNAIVIGEDRVLNEGGLRFQDEFVRHKILDILGDMSLFGFPIEGHIIANESGHRLHLSFLKYLAAHQDSWDINALPYPKTRGRAVPLSQEVAA